MGQYWTFFNVDEREYADPNGLAKFPEWFYNKQGFLVRSLAIPYPNPKLEGYLKKLEDKPFVMPEKGFAALPDDILTMVINCGILSMPTVGSLAVTCRRLYAICADEIEYHKTYRSARWAFCRIACLGDYATYDDLPEGLLNDKERAIIRPKLEEKGADKSHGGLMCLDLKSAYLWRGVFEWKGGSLDMNWLRNVSPADKQAYNMVMGITFPEDRKDWILCNNVKREFVRASEIARLCGRPDSKQPFLPDCRVDLGHALLTRICWSFDSSGVPTEKTKTHRVAWVGDTFCIVTMDRRMQPAEGEPEWKDVSGDVVRDLLQIFRAQWGKEHWRPAMQGMVQGYPQEPWFWCDEVDDMV